MRTLASRQMMDTATATTPSPVFGISATRETKKQLDRLMNAEPAWARPAADAPSPKMVSDRSDTARTAGRSGLRRAGDRAGHQGAGDAGLPVACPAIRCALATFAARRRLIHIQMNTWITSGEYLVRWDAGANPGSGGPTICHQPTLVA